MDVVPRGELARVAEIFAEPGGPAFFQKVVDSVRDWLGVDHAWISEVTGASLEETGRARVVAAAPPLDEPTEYDLADTPCEEAAARGMCLFTDGVQQAFPKDSLLGRIGARAYAGVPLRSPDDGVIGILEVMSSRPFEDGELAGAVIGLFAARVSLELERERSRAQLEQRERRFRALLEYSGEAITLFDGHSQVLYHSPSFGRMLGHAPEKRAGASIFDLVHPEDRERLVDFIDDVRRAQGEPRTGMFRMRNVAGEWRHIEATARNLLDDPDVRGIVVNSRDLTAALAAQDAVNRARQQLRQTDRMEAIGRAASGIAHDFRNILTGVLGTAQLLEEEDLPEGIRQDVATIRAEAERGARLAAELLVVQRQKADTLDRVDAADELARLRPVLERVLTGRHRLELDLPDSPVMVDAGGVLLERALTNLIANARDALPDGGSVRIRLRTCDAAATGIPGLRAIDHAVIEVMDDGAGMDEQTRVRAFEPFFTTRSGTRGTGLGLSTVWGIAARLGGDVSIDSAPGTGTTVRLYLPTA